MQLCTAALQHTSSALQHLLPAVQQKVPQQADALLQVLQQRSKAVVELGDYLMVLLNEVDKYRQTTPQGEQRLQQLLLSPHCLPVLATLVALQSTLFNVSCSQPAARGSQGSETSSAGTTSSSRGGGSRRLSRGDSCGSTTTQHRQHSGSKSSNSRSGEAVSSTTTISNTLTPLQLQLFELLGLAPQLTTMKQLPGPLKMASFNSPHLIGLYHQAMIDLFDGLDEQQVQMKASEQLDEQRWRFEQQLWLLLPSLLLPSLLLPCADNLLLLSSGTIMDPARKPTQREREAGDGLAWGLVEVSNRALHGHHKLCNRLEGGPSHRTSPSLSWAGELLDGVLQLADHLLLQQPSQAEPHAQSTAASGSSQTSNSTPAAAPAAPSPPPQAAMPSRVPGLGELAARER